MLRKEIPTVPCEICGRDTQYTGTKRCNNCWEVEGRLADFVRNKEGLRVVRETLEAVFPDRASDPHLRDLYIELDGVEIAIDNAYFRVEAQDLNRRRAELLGEIKELERKYNESS